MLIQTSMNVSQFWDGLVMGRDPQQATYTTCPRQRVSGNTSGEFVIRTDFLLYILRNPVSEYFLPGASKIEPIWQPLRARGAEPAFRYIPLTAVYPKGR